MRFWTIIVLLFCLAACSATYNATIYPYIDKRQAASPALHNVMLASVNLGIPSRHYLASHEEAIDEQLQAYLKKHDYTVQGNKGFQQQWKNAEQRYGTLFNPATGQQTAAHTQALQDVLQAVFTNHPTLDAIIFTDLIETPVYYQSASRRFAEWHGVHRSVKVEGIGTGVNDSFNWAEPVDAISIAVSVFDRQQNLVFHSVGGIQVVQALFIGNNTAEFRRRNDLLINNKEIMEGIELALHPLIPMDDYPAPPQ